MDIKVPRCYLISSLLGLVLSASGARTWDEWRLDPHGSSNHSLPLVETSAAGWLAAWLAGQLAGSLSCWAGFLDFWSQRKETFQIKPLVLSTSGVKAQERERWLEPNGSGNHSPPPRPKHLLPVGWLLGWLASRLGHWTAGLAGFAGLAGRRVWFSGFVGRRLASLQSDTLDAHERSSD